MAIDQALRKGKRGLPGGSSLARLLAKQRRVPRHIRKTLFDESNILAWADAFHARTGRWPKYSSGFVAEAPEETWARINDALSKGKRGLRGGTTLAALLAHNRNVRSRVALEHLS